MNPDKKDRYWWAAAFLLPFCCLLGYLIIHGIAPFGNGSFLIYDMNHQYVDFFAYYGSVLRGENDIRYSLCRGLGGEFFSLWAYYLANPLSLIPALLPDVMIPAAISLEMLLLFGLTGLSCFFVLCYFVPEGDRRTLLFLSSAYALSGWMLVNAENFQFLPSAAALPMVVSALDRLKRENRIIPAIVWLVLTFLLNFYMGYMVWGFGLLWMLLPDDQSRRKRTLLAFVISALVCIPFMLLLIRPLTLSIKSPDDSWYLPRINISLSELLKIFLPGQFKIWYILDNGLPAVYCGLITLCCSVFYFLRFPIRARKIHRLLLLLILFLSLIFRPFALAWQGFSQPHWWPYRFSFLLIFMIILTASESRLRLHPILLILCLTELCFNMEHTFSAKLTKAVPWDSYRSKVTEKRDRIEALWSEDPELYRIEDLMRRSDNDSMHFSAPGITCFESMTRESSFRFLERLGFPTDRYTVSYGHGNTGFANALLGVRYILNGPETMQSEVMPGMAFWAIDGYMTLPDAENPLDFQNALARQLGAKDSLLSGILPDEREDENLSCTEEFCWKDQMGEQAFVRLVFSAEKDSVLYVHSEPEGQIGDMVLRTDTQEIHLDPSDYFLPLGKINAGEKMTAEIEIRDPLGELSALSFITEDLDTLFDLGEKLFSGLTLTKVRSSELRADFSPSDIGRTLVITIPYDSGWNAHSNDVPLEISPYLDTFLAVEIPAGITGMVIAR